MVREGWIWIEGGRVCLWWVSLNEDCTRVVCLGFGLVWPRCPIGSDRNRIQRLPRVMTDVMADSGGLISWEAAEMKMISKRIRIRI